MKKVFNQPKASFLYLDYIHTLPAVSGDIEGGDPLAPGRMGGAGVAPAAHVTTINPEHMSN